MASKRKAKEKDDKCQTLSSLGFTLERGGYLKDLGTHQDEKNEREEKIFQQVGQKTFRCDDVFTTEPEDGKKRVRFRRLYELSMLCFD